MIHNTWSNIYCKGGNEEMFETKLEYYQTEAKKTKKRVIISFNGKELLTRTGTEDSKGVTYYSIKRIKYTYMTLKKHLSKFNGKTEEEAVKYLKNKA